MQESRGPLSGSRFGGYEVQGLVGSRGGMDRYRARQVSLDRPVDLTVLTPDGAKKAPAVLLFDRVLNVIVQLRHENVIASIDAGEIGGTRFFVMEHLEGATLAEAFAHGEEFALPRALEVVLGIGRAIAYLDEAGIVHRDVSPATIVVSPLPGVPVKLAGFFSAKAKGPRMRETWFDADTDGAAYIAPDRIRGGRRLNWRADAYSLGCVLYRLVTGRPPFAGVSAAAILDAHLGRRPRDPRTIVADLPEGVVRVLDRCLRKEPETRYDSCADFVKDLSALRAGSVPPTPDPGPLLWPTRPATSHPVRRPRPGLDRPSGVVRRIVPDVFRDAGAG